MLSSELGENSDKAIPSREQSNHSSTFYDRTIIIIVNFQVTAPSATMLGKGKKKDKESKKDKEKEKEDKKKSDKDKADKDKADKDKAVVNNAKDEANNNQSKETTR